MRLLTILCLALALCIAKPALAVSINEVAWMGSVDSANYEWIELYNESDVAVNVDGWTLKDGMNLIINLAGTIAPREYAVLERTSEESAAGTAFLLYTGALVNTGATLVLKDASEVIVDQVTGGVDWENIGGDNTTKETAQYTTQGWVTDTPTPGAQNGTGRVEELTTPEPAAVVVSTQSSGSSGSKKSSSESVRLKNTETKMLLTLNMQSVAYVNQIVVGSVTTGGIDSRAQNMVHYEWNFGDTYTVEGKKVEHTYRYPGTYVVTVHGRNGKSEQVARQEITVLPVNFSITYNEAGDIQIHNDAPYDVDLSGYVLRGVDSVTFPPRTVILPRATITIDSTRLGSAKESLVALYDSKKTLVTSTYENDFSFLAAELDLEWEEELQAANTPTGGAAMAAPPVGVFAAPYIFAPATAEAATTETVEEIEAKTETPLTNQTPAEKNVRWPYLAFIALLLTALVGMFIAHKKV